LVTIAARHAGRDSRSIPGNLEAIGERRVLVLAEEPLKRGTEIRINADSHVLSGIVECCNAEAPLGFFLEIRLKRESRWSEQWFKPKHLLAVGVPKKNENSTKALPLENTSVTEYFVRVIFAHRLQVKSARAADGLSCSPRSQHVSG
jgi:hypothetical protein